MVEQFGGLRRAQCRVSSRRRDAHIVGSRGPDPADLRGKKEFSALSVRHKEVVIDRLPGLFGDLEPYRLAGLLLANRRSLNSVSVRSNILDFEGDDIDPRSLLSIARLNSAKSRFRSAI